MSLADVVQNGVDLALDITDPFLVDAILRKITLGAYDPLTDTQPETVVDVPLRGLLYNATEHERQFIFPTAKRMVETKKFLASRTYMQGIDLDTEDRIIADGVEYEIAKIRDVPSQPIVIFFITRAG